MLTASDVTDVLREISPLLRGGWIQKIRQPTDRTLVLDVRVPGRTHRLMICCQTGLVRLHLTTRTLANPPTPPPFCLFLRAHVQGARIDDIRQIGNDLIVELQITGRQNAHAIVCELTGHKANILVLDAERRVLSSLTGQHCPTGQVYAFPNQRETDQRASSRFTGRVGGMHPVSEAIDAFYREQEAAHTIDRIKEERRRALKKTLTKELRLIEAWRNDLARATVYRNYARYGELIKANISAITKGIDHIEMTDYFDDSLPTITIPLDPMKSAHGNMDDYFRKHRKYLAAERALMPRIEQAEQGIDRLRGELQQIEHGTWTPPVALPARPNAATVLAPATGRPLATDQRRGPFRRFTSTDGLPIFVGRNARENDELTFKFAKSDDFWLHARGIPGSHVIVRLGKGTDPPPETLRDAAMLALLYSDLKKCGKGDVIYTRRKWVKKAKGQAPGAVVVTQEKSLHVSLEKNRLEALKSRAS